jgi:hypothetical protein
MRRISLAAISRSLALGAGRQQNRRSAGRLTQADGRDVVLDELHRVVDREEGRDVAAGTVDVDVDVLVGVFTLEVDQLSADQIGDGVVDRGSDEKDVLLEETAVEVVGALATVGLLDHRRNEVVVGLEIHQLS